MNCIHAASILVMATVGCVTLSAEPATTKPEMPAKLSDLEKAAANPKASGLLILRLVGDSAGAKAGLREGDIVTKYGEMPVVEVVDLMAAIQAKAGLGATRGEVVYVRDGVTAKMAVPAGKLGIRVEPVIQGKPYELWPAATDVRFDFSALEKSPREEWMTFSINKEKCGFEYQKLTLKDGTLTLLSEVAFVSKNFGKQHFVVTTTASVRKDGTLPRFESSVYEFPMGNYTCTLKRKNETTMSVQVKDGKTGKEEADEVALPADAQSDYLAAQLAPYMTRKTDACFHYALITLTGEIQRYTAMKCVGEEAIEINGKKTPGMRIQQSSEGKPGRSTWVDAKTGAVLMNNYGGDAIAVPSTKDEALMNLDASIKPVLAATLPAK